MKEHIVYLALGTNLGDRLARALSLKRLGDVHADYGRSDRARVVWGEALSVLEDLAHPEAEAVAERLQRLARS